MLQKCIFPCLQSGNFDIMLHMMFSSFFSFSVIQFHVVRRLGASLLALLIIIQHRQVIIYKRTPVTFALKVIITLRSIKQCKVLSDAVQASRVPHTSKAIESRVFLSKQKRCDNNTGNAYGGNGENRARGRLKARGGGYAEVGV
jgi:hypothetical protein